MEPEQARSALVGQGGRVLELDGFRGVAVLVVLISHMAAGTWPASRRMFDWWDGGGGGLVGVQMFFVLSGFLITGVLLRELDKSKSILLGPFYIRRIRRLMPALAIVTFAVLTYGYAAGLQSDEMLGPAVRTLTYTSNLPFLDRIAGVGWLAHTWSLAVEEQFYLIWPFVVMLAFAMGKGRAREVLFICALGGVFATIGVRFMVPMDDSYMYNLARWDALLIGCAIAARPISVHRVVGHLAWVVIAWYVIMGSGEIAPADYTITTFASAVALTCAVGTRALSNPLMRWFGTISYGLYLWSVLIFRLGPPPLAGLVASVGAAAVSYYLVERRFIDAKPLDEMPQPP